MIERPNLAIDDLGSAAFVCKHVARGLQPICRCFRTEPDFAEDSGWQFLCGQGEVEGPGAAEIWALQEVLEFEPSLWPFVEAAGERVGIVIWRADGEAPWRLDAIQ